LNGFAIYQKKKEENGDFFFFYLSIRGKSNGRQVEFCDNKLPLFEGSSLFVAPILSQK
jgi:hypothetical protein